MSSPLSDFMSSMSLPVGADSRVHASLRRSANDLDHKPVIVANALASEAKPNNSHPYIAPSSIHDIPRSQKKALRRHPILFWVLIAVFDVSLIALTAAVVLAAFIKGREVGQTGVQCAAVIVGVCGFSGVVGSAAVIWMILRKRRRRKRLEARWVEEERVKDARGVRERWIESRVRESIWERERSLSRRSRRGRKVPGDRKMMSEGRISFKSMTPMPTSSSQGRSQSQRSKSRRVQSPWPRSLNISDGSDDSDDRTHENNTTQYKHKVSSSQHPIDAVEIRDSEVLGIECNKARKIPRMRVSTATHFLDLDPSDSEDDEDGECSVVEFVGQREEAIEMKMEFKRLSFTCPGPTYLDEKPLPEIPDEGPLSPRIRRGSNTATTTITYRDSANSHFVALMVPYNSPQISRQQHHRKQPPPSPSPSTFFFLLDTKLLNSKLANLAHHHPTSSFSTSSSSSSFSSPSSLSSSHLHTIIPRLNNGNLGSEQSDLNFQAMLEMPDDLADYMGSEDERVREGRERAVERVEMWVCGVRL